MQMLSKLKLRARREKSESASVQLIGNGEACVKALKTCNMHWNSVLDVVVILP